MRGMMRLKNIFTPQNMAHIRANNDQASSDQRYVALTSAIVDNEK